MKTFDKKDVYTCVTAEEAKKYVGELGYPSNSLNKLKTLINNFAPYSLDKIELDNDKPFFYRDDGFLFFLPADKVKEVEESISFSINCTNSQLESYLEALNFVIGLATMICPKDELHLVSLAEELENILNKGLAK